jgi:hypothetical protein
MDLLADRILERDVHDVVSPMARCPGRTGAVRALPLLIGRLFRVELR